MKQMSVEQVRGILRKWGQAEETVRCLNEMKSRTQELLDSLNEDVSFGAQPMTGMPSAHSLSDPTSRNLIQRESIASELDNYDRMISETIQLKGKIDFLLFKSQFNPKFLKVIQMRYISGDKWEVIANELNISVTGVRDRERAICEQLRSFMVFDTLVQSVA